MHFAVAAEIVMLSVAKSYISVLLGTAGCRTKACPCLEGADENVELELKNPTALQLNQHTHPFHGQRALCLEMNEKGKAVSNVGTTSLVLRVPEVVRGCFLQHARTRPTQERRLSLVFLRTDCRAGVQVACTEGGTQMLLLAEFAGLDCGFVFAGAELSKPVVILLPLGTTLHPPS